MLAELAQVHLAALVRAVLAPHDRVHRQLGLRRPAAEHLADAGVLVVLEPELERRAAPRRGSAPASSTVSVTPADQGLQHAGEEAEAVGAGAGQLLDRVLGVGHDPDDVARLVADAGDVAHRAVRVAADVVGDHPALGLERVEGRRVGDVAPSPFFTGTTIVLGQVATVQAVERLLIRRRWSRLRKRRRLVAGERARQQVALAEDLEAVADAEHRQPGAGLLGHRRHHRAEAGDRAGAQVVAVGEAAGEHHGVDAVQVRVGVPEGDRLPAGEADGALRVAVVEAAGEGDDADLHRPEATGRGCRPTCRPGSTARARSAGGSRSTAGSPSRATTGASSRGGRRCPCAAGWRRSPCRRGRA